MPFLVTPLEVVDMLSRARTHADVCLVSGKFGDHERHELTAFLLETFPWIRIAALRTDGADDVGDAADAAIASWRDVQDTDWK